MRQTAYILPKGRGGIVLILDRKVGQWVGIGGGTYVRVLSIKNEVVRLGIETPSELSIVLEEEDSPVIREVDKEVKISRKNQEGFWIGGIILVKITKVRPTTIKLGVEAPNDIEIFRGEISPDGVGPGEGQEN